MNEVPHNSNAALRSRDRGHDDLDRFIRLFRILMRGKFRNATLGDLANVGQLILNIVLIAVGVVAAVIYGKQLVEMSKSTALAATATKNAEDAMKLDERAWVSVFDVVPEGRGDQLKVTVVFRNTGKTPAKSFVVEASGEPVNGSHSARTKELVLPGRGVIAPGGQFHSVFDISGDIFAATKVAMHGRVAYTTVFGSPHWSTFCFYIVPKSKGSNRLGFVPCETGNEIDSNSE
jgi:hypothetical protein